MSYLRLFADSWTNYAGYLIREITQPNLHSYFYWLIAISLAVYGLELVFPWRRGQARLRRDFWIDAFYMFFNFFLFSLVGYFALSEVVVRLFRDGMSAAGLESLVALDVGRWPVLVQLLTLFVLRDFVHWNVHRLLHRVAWLWEFHKVHHSVVEMGFAAHLRFHWMETVVYRTIEYIPLALVGYGIDDFMVVHLAALTIGHLNHANLYVPLGPLGYLINNPQMHIWHHARSLPVNRPLGMNYGISLSIWDYLFRTAHIPGSGRDIELGFEEIDGYPSTFMGHALRPFAALGSSGRVAAGMLVLCVSLCGIGTARAQNLELTFRVTVPADTPAEDSVFIAGDFQGWNPGSGAHGLTPLGGNLHEIALQFAPGTRLEFKFTRGDWSRVEKGPSGEEIGNRVLTVNASQLIELTVARWADTETVHTTVGDVSVITVPGFLDGRSVWVYLPPGYHDDPERRYRVLYMFDGQNVFDAATSFAGEWKVDETCEALVPALEIEPFIVVAVANGGIDRLHEYTPWLDAVRGGGGGEEHIQAFIQVLMPYVNAQYRTLEGPAHTGISGSSLGGLMSVYVALAHSDRFGLIAGLSPSVQWADHALIDLVESLPKPEVKLYIDMGTLESGAFQDQNGNDVDDAIDDLRALRDALVAKGFVIGEDLMVFEDEGAHHNEAFWAARFPDALRYLFPVRSVASPPDTMGTLKFRHRGEH